MGHSRPLFHLFSSFQTNITIFTTSICEKCPSSIWCWDSNPRPSGDESPPITTRPGLPPKPGPSFKLTIFDKLESNLATCPAIETLERSSSLWRRTGTEHGPTVWPSTWPWSEFTGSTPGPTPFTRQPTTAATIARSSEATNTSPILSPFRCSSLTCTGPTGGRTLSWGRTSGGLKMLRSLIRWDLLRFWTE